MLELHYPTVTKTILERQYPGKPTLKVAFGNGNGAIFENSSKLRASLFVTSRWPRSSGQTNYQVHHPSPTGLLAGGGGELGSLFVRTILAIVTSRRVKRATSRSFRKWRRCHFQMLLLKLVSLDIDAPKWFLSR